MKNNIILDDKDIITLKKKGCLLKREVLSPEMVSKAKQIIKLNKAGKGGKDTYYASNYKILITKLLTLDFKRLINSFFFLNIKDKLKLDKYANELFEEKSKLTMIDGYHNEKNDKDILPWHSDHAYSGEKDIKNIKSPDIYYYKFFFILRM